MGLAVLASCSGKQERRTSAATLTWEWTDSDDMLIKVEDASGSAIPNVDVDTVSHSGGAGNETLTDAQGVVSLRPGEREVVNIRVNGVSLLSEDDYLFGDYGGVVMTIVVTDSVALGITTREEQVEH